MIEMMIGLVAWVSVGAVAALVVGRASTIGASSAVPCRLSRTHHR